MDSRFGIPGTSWRFGIDGLVGLIPGIGDAAGALVSLYIVAEARRLGVRKSTLFKMVVNIALDAVAGAVPIIGDLFDFGWKANQRNVRLMERDLVGRTVKRPSDR